MALRRAQKRPGSGVSWRSTGRRRPGQPLRQTTQPTSWSEATIRQPAGASGQPAWADCPAGQPVSTTVVPAGSGCRPGVNCFNSVQETSNACGTVSIQPSEGAKATWSPGRTLPASISVIASWVFDPWACEMWLVIWATATRLTAATQTPNTADTVANARPGRSLRSTNAKPIHNPSRTSVTAVASATLAFVQFWVTTAGSAKLNPAPNPCVGTVVPI